MTFTCRILLRRIWRRLRKFLSIPSAITRADANWSHFSSTPPGSFAAGERFDFGVPKGGNADNRGFSVTNLGRSWIASGALALIVLDITRLSELFATLSDRLGAGFLQRANEAARCHSFGANLAACAMCGAAAELIMLAVAIAKTGDEGAVLKTYLGPQGRKRTIDAIIHGARDSFANAFKAATDLLSYWRDEAAHGTASEISQGRGAYGACQACAFCTIRLRQLDRADRPSIRYLTCPPELGPLLGHAKSCQQNTLRYQ